MVTRRSFLVLLRTQLARRSTRLGTPVQRELHARLVRQQQDCTAHQLLDTKAFMEPISRRLCGPHAAIPCEIPRRFWYRNLAAPLPRREYTPSLRVTGKKFSGRYRSAGLETTARYGVRGASFKGVIIWVYSCAVCLGTSYAIYCSSKAASPFAVLPFGRSD